MLADAFAAGTQEPSRHDGARPAPDVAGAALQNYGENPAVMPGLKRLTLTATSLRSPLAYLTPGPVHVQLRDAVPAQHLEPLSEPICRARRCASTWSSSRTRRASEAVPSQRPYTTPRTRNGQLTGPIHMDPYPNTDSPGQTPECSAGNETYSGASARDRQPAGQRRAARPRRPRGPSNETPPQPGSPTSPPGLIAIAVIGDRLLPACSAARAVQRQAIRAEGDVHLPDAAAHPVAGADRRGRRRRGRVGATGLRRRPTRRWSR